MTQTHSPSGPASAPPSASEIGLLALIVLTTGVRYAVVADDPLFFDEYYHLLAARSWASDGTLTVGDGVYTRAAWLSIAVGALFRVFGESILVATVATACVTTVWVAILFAWTYREAGRIAAWAAALAFGLSPLVLANSMMIRFYGVAGLLLAIAVISLFTVLSRVHHPLKAAALVLLATGCVWAANGTTRLTRLWVGGLILWAVSAAALRIIRSRHRAVAALLASALFVVVLGALWQSGWVEANWIRYRETQIWALARADDIRWYENLIRRSYPTLWTGLPIAVILALIGRPKLAGICLSVFLVGFALLSGAGPKAERYALPILPFFFVIWGVAVAQFLPALREWISVCLDRVLGHETPHGLRQVGMLLFLTAVFGFVLLTNPGFSGVRNVLAGHLPSQDRPPLGAGASPDGWERLAPILRRTMGEVGVVVTANSLQTLYHVGDYDYAMHPTIVGELVPPRDFSIDPREGRPVISTLRSLQDVIEQHESGVIFGDRWRWGHRSSGFTVEIAEFIYTNLREVPLPEELGVVAYRWGPGP